MTKGQSWNPDETTKQLHAGSILDKPAQAGKGGVPLLRDEVEVAAGVLKALLIQLPEAFAAAACAAYKAGVLHHPQMLGDGLTRNSGSRGEFADGGRSSLTKPNDQL